MAMQARLKTEFSPRYPRLSHSEWYEVAPIFPGVTIRRVDMFGRRVTRLKTPRDYETVQAAHFEFRPRPELGEAPAALPSELSAPVPA
jgi:hypothetical protein